MLPLPRGTRPTFEGITLGAVQPMVAAAMESCDSPLPQASSVRRLVIVADNSLVIEAIRLGFRESGEFRLVGYADPRRSSAQTILGAKPDAILFDDLGGGGATLELLREITQLQPQLDALMLSMN